MSIIAHTKMAEVIQPQISSQGGVSNEYKKHYRQLNYITKKICNKTSIKFYFFCNNTGELVTIGRRAAPLRRLEAPLVPEINDTNNTEILRISISVSTHKEVGDNIQNVENPLPCNITS